MNTDSGEIRELMQDLYDDGELKIKPHDVSYFGDIIRTCSSVAVSQSIGAIRLVTWEVGHVIENSDQLAIAMAVLKRLYRRRKVVPNNLDVQRDIANIRLGVNTYHAKQR